MVPVLVVLAGLAGGASAAASATTTGKAGKPEQANAMPASSQRMAERVKEIFAKTDPATHAFRNAEHVAALRQALAMPNPPPQEMQLRMQLVQELMNAGEPAAAVPEIDRLVTMMTGGRGEAPPDIAHQAAQIRALAYLRMGEQANCVAHHGAESCLLPIAGSGIHTDQEGSRLAMKELNSLLARWPDDLQARWLLNIAAMTLGAWPAGVPEPFRIAPEMFKSEYDIGRFPDVAAKAGIQVRGLAGGTVAEDLDGDGDLDLLMSHMNVKGRMYYYRNDGNGHFTDRTAEAGLAGMPGGLNLIHADYDNDGDADVLVLRGAWLREAGLYPNSLLRNRGDGFFDDVTEAAGILTFHPTQNAAWADYDGDGWVDLFVGNESTPANIHPSELWRNNKNGTFSDRSTDLPTADLGYVKGSAWGDLDNDGRPDLYLSVHGGENLLFHNNGPAKGTGHAPGAWSFTEVGRKAGVTEPIFSFPTWWFDYDNDGWDDILVGGYKTPSVADAAAVYLHLPGANVQPKLYRNRHDGTFEDVTHAVALDRVALPMGANFGDLDNDGWLDCYFGTGEPGLATIIPNRMFRNDRGKRFQDVNTAGGFAHLQKGHAIAFADLDQDGDQDVIEEMGGAFEADVAHSVLYENPGHGNHWITLRLVGKKANRAAIGARIKAHIVEPAGPATAGLEKSERDVYLTAGTGGSFGASSLQQEIGLGKATALARLEVRWPGSGTVQTFTDVAMDQVYRLVEGGKLEPVPTKPFKLGGQASSSAAAAPAVRPATLTEAAAVGGGGAGSR